MVKKKKEETKAIETKKKNILLEEKVDVESIRKELKDYIDETVNQTFIDQLDKSNKKIIHEKNKKIVWKNIVIIILLLIIGFLVYLLYTNNYFDHIFNKNNEIVEKDKKDKEKPKEDEKKEEKKEPTLAELKSEYGKLLDNYYVTDNSIYLVNFYNGNLTTDMMKYMTLNSFDFSSLAKEDDYNIIKESTFKTMFENLFDIDYISSTFDYEDNKVRYVKIMDSYITESLLVREDNNIVREIKDIKVDGGEVIITTVEGLVKDGRLYDVITNKEIEGYKEDSLLKYENELNKLVYKFKNNKLISLSK